MTAKRKTKVKAQTQMGAAGRQYRVTPPERNLAYPMDQRVIKRLLAGEAVPWEERGEMKKPKVGDLLSASDLPERCWASLVERGLVEEVGDGSER